MGTIGLALAAAGCQEQSGVPLGPGSLTGDPVNAARLVLFDPCADFSQPDKVAAEMLEAINAERTRRHLDPLKLNNTLTQVADFYACRLIDGAFFSHIDPYDGSTLDTRATNFGYAFQKVGENLAMGQRSVSQAMVDWMASSSHRANLLDPAFTEVGIAVKIGVDSGPFWVQEFGRPVSESNEFELSELATPKRDRASSPTTQSESSSSAQPAEDPISDVSKTLGDILFELEYL